MTTAVKADLNRTTRTRARVDFRQSRRSVSLRQVEWETVDEWDGLVGVGRSGWETGLLFLKMVGEHA